jgi:CubicO group peptidase (beta-lactamase class C family)
MKMGTKQYEDLFVMENSDRFVLERPMVAVPGTRWSYSGGPAVLIGKLIEDGTGMALDDYGRDRLFQPLGITHWYWARRPDGVPSAASGLRMTARDLAKIGQMVLDGGMFDGRQVVPRGWLDELFPPRRARRTISSLSAACQQPFS